MARTPSRTSLRAVPLVLAAAVLLVGSLPAGGQAPEPPVVSISFATAPGSLLQRDCDGERVPVLVAGTVVLERTGPLAGELTVGLEVTGDRVAALEEVPTSATFPAGESEAIVLLRLTEGGPGSLSVALVGGPGHELGDPASADLVVGPLAEDGGYDCLNPFELDPARLDQVIAVGEVPEPLGFAAPAAEEDRARRDLPLVGDYVLEVRGSLPPGLTYDEDVWGGAATTPGVYRFGVSLCIAPGAIVPVVQCVGTASAQVTVVEEVGPGGPPSAPAATPVAARARFTG